MTEWARRRVAALATAMVSLIVAGATLVGAADAATPSRLLVRVANLAGFQVRGAAGQLIGRIPTGAAVPETAAADSPDGRRIAFVASDGFLWVVSSDGRDRRRLVRADQITPVWSPDGRSLAVEDVNGRAALVAWPAGGMSETQLPGNRGLAFSPDGWLWSADGDIVAHVQLQGVPPGAGGALQPWGQPAPDDLFAGSSDNLAISPDGRTAAYLRYEGIGSVREALYEQPRGGAQHELLPGPDFSHSGGNLAFSPDGRLLAVNWTTPQHGLFGQLWLLGAGGGAPRVVSLTTDEFARPAWSPRGTTVAIGLPAVGVALVGRDGAVRRPSGLGGAQDPSWTTVKPPAGRELPIRRLRLTLPTLSVAGGRIVDAHGRQVMLRGVNVNALVQYYVSGPFAPVFPLFAGDPAKMAGIGWDAVRLNVSWSRVEPRPGRFDDRYLSQVATTVRRLARAGIYSIIDMHQDVWSATLAARPDERCPPGFQNALAYDGAPAWATLSSNLPRCWNQARELDPAVLAAWRAFFSNTKDIQSRYVAMWGRIARRFARERGVAGFDLMNEPNSFGRLEDHRLSAMYARALQAIRAGERAGHGPAHLVLFEPSVTFSSPQFGPGGAFGTFSGPPPDFARDKNTVYAPHLYTGGFDNGPITKQAFAQVASEAHGLHNTPVVLGEWGTDPLRAAQGDPYFLDHQAFQDDYQFGGLLWLWRESCGTPGADTHTIVWGEFDVDCTTNTIVGERTPLIFQLQRGYVRAAAGRLHSMRWSPSEQALTASGNGGGGSGPMIAFLPPGERPRVQSHGLHHEYLAHAPGGGWYVVATARGGSWSFTARS